MNKNSRANIFSKFDLTVDDLQAEEIPDEVIENMTQDEFEKLAVRVSNIMSSTLADVVHQACVEQGIKVPVDEE